MLSTSVLARTDCPPAKIIHIQIEGKIILYSQQGASWRQLGEIGNGDGTEERYAAILAAQATGKSVMVGYPDSGHDCGVTDYGTAAFLVRTY